MSEDIEAMKKAVYKGMRIEAITNTFTEMLAKHPDQEEALTIMLKVKLKALED